MSGGRRRQPVDRRATRAAMIAVGVLLAVIVCRASGLDLGLSDWLGGLARQLLRLGFVVGILWVCLRILISGFRGGVSLKKFLILAVAAPLVLHLALKILPVFLSDLLRVLTHSIV